MMIIKNGIIRLLLMITAITVINLTSLSFTSAADASQVVINSNLKPGMSLSDAIELLGPPETMIATDNGSVVVPYKNIGLSIEVMSEGKTVERIHIEPSFKGSFKSGIEMGQDYLKIISLYEQPDIMTKELVEYSKSGITFTLKDGKITGADLYSEKSRLKEPAPSKVVKKQEKPAVNKTEEKQPRKYIEEEETDDDYYEDEYDEKKEKIDILAVFGLKVEKTLKGVIITEIMPSSPAEEANLKKGQEIRKAFYKGGQKLNIFSVSGLESILERAYIKRKRIVNILQEDNFYYKLKVPRRNR